MTRTNSIRLVLSPSERVALKILVEHVKADLSYREGGTFVNLDGTDSFDTRDAKLAEKGVSVIERVLINYGN